MFYAAAWRSILLATLSTAIALTIGTMAAYALTRYKLPAADLTKAFLLSPIVLPKIVLGVALFMFFVRVRLIDNYSSLLVTHVLVILPFVDRDGERRARQFRLDLAGGRDGPRRRPDPDVLPHHPAADFASAW